MSEGIAVARDTVQRIFELVRVRTQIALGKNVSPKSISNQELAEWYSNPKVQLHGRAEAVTKSFVETGMMVCNSILRR